MNDKRKQRLLLLSLLLIFSAVGYSQQPGLWTGVSDDDWGNYQNWDDSNVPDNNDDVVIPAGCTNYPNIVKPLIVGSTFIAGDKYRCKTLDIQTGGQIISKNALEVNGAMTISGLYLYDEEYLSGTHVVNSGGSITVTMPGSLFIGTDGFIPDLKQDLIVNSGGSVTTAGYFNVNDCLIIHSGASFTMTGGFAQILGYEANYNSTYPGSFYVASGASGGVSAGDFYVQGKEVSGYYALSINEPTFDFTGTSTLYLYVEPDQSLPYPDYSIYAVNGVSFTDVVVNNQGTVTTLASNMQVDGDFTIETPSCFTISSNNTLNVMNDFLMKSDMLAMADMYSSLIENGQLLVTGTSKVQWQVEGDKWHFISSPVANETANVFTGMSMMEYTESTNLWSYLTSLSTSLTVMKGFAAFLNASWWQSIYFEGTVNNGTIGSTNNLSKSSNGWNLVGNPYPSAIDWDAVSGWTKTNINNAIYIEYNGNWATYINGVGTNGGSKYIPPCHGFFVQVNTDPGTLIMNNNVRVHNKPIYMKNFNSPVIRLLATNLDTGTNYRSDETVIRFNAMATTGFDGNFDAHKLMTWDDFTPQIYTSPYDLSINTLPTPETTILKFEAGTSANYKIEATELGGLTYIGLKDLLTGSEIDLTQSSYTFSYTVGESSDRFMLFFNPTEIESFGQDLHKDILVFSSNHQVFITISEEQLTTIGTRSLRVIIYDSMGRQIRQEMISSIGTSSVYLPSAGVYFINLEADNFCQTTKIHIY